MYLELYDKDLKHIINIEIISRSSEERVFDSNSAQFKCTCNQKIDAAVLYVIKDKPRPFGAYYPAGFVKNIKYPAPGVVEFKGEDLRKVYSIDALLDWSNGTIDLSLKGIFEKVADAIYNAKDAMVGNIPVFFEIPNDTQDVSFIADYSHRYIVVNLEKFLKVYLAYFGYYIEARFNQYMQRIDFRILAQGSPVKINIKDFLHEKTTSDIKTNKVIATISFNTVEEKDTEWIVSDEGAFDSSISKNTLLGTQGNLPALPDPNTYENLHILRRVEYAFYEASTKALYDAAIYKATINIPASPFIRSTCPSVPPSGTAMWNEIQKQPFDDKVIYKGIFYYQSSTDGQIYYCSQAQYGKSVALGIVDYHQKVGSIYTPRPDLPQRIYTLGTDNQIYSGFAPFEKRIYPVQQKIFESEYLATAQINAVSELVNTRYVENIILTDDNASSPIPLTELPLNTLVWAYDENGEYKELPVAEKRYSEDAKGIKVEVKLGFKKTKLTEIIKNDIALDPIVKQGSKGGSTVINEYGSEAWTEATTPDPVLYKSWFKPI
jgi:hypothetical protein